MFIKKLLSVFFLIHQLIGFMAYSHGVKYHKEVVVDEPDRSPTALPEPPGPPQLLVEIPQIKKELGALSLNLFLGQAARLGITGGPWSTVARKEANSTPRSDLPTSSRGHVGHNSSSAVALGSLDSYAVFVTEIGAQAGLRIYKGLSLVAKTSGTTEEGVSDPLLSLIKISRPSPKIGLALGLTTSFPLSDSSQEAGRLTLVGGFVRTQFSLGRFDLGVEGGGGYYVYGGSSKLTAESILQRELAQGGGGFTLGTALSEIFTMGFGANLVGLFFENGFLLWAPEVTPYRIEISTGSLSAEAAFSLVPRLGNGTQFGHYQIHPTLSIKVQYTFGDPSNLGVMH